MSANESRTPVGIVIASHGDLARAMLRSAEMIVGEQEDAVTVCLKPEDSPESFQIALTAAVEKADRGAGVVVFIDLFGGTPGNAAASSLSQRQVPIVSGVNLPMLLEALMSRSAVSPQALAARALESGNKGILDVTTRLNSQMQAAPSDVQD